MPPDGAAVALVLHERLTTRRISGVALGMAA
jgi:hypothetical protein